MNEELIKLLSFEQYNLVMNGRCPICGEKVDRSTLKGDYLLEFNISGMCKKCQDKLFND